METISPEVFPIAPNLLALLQEDKLWEWLIDTFYNIFHVYALTIKDEKNKNQAKKSLDFLDKLKTIEGQEQVKDQQDIEDLENMLKNI